MTDQQPNFQSPAGRYTQQKPTVRHWDGNGWTQPTPAVSPAVNAARTTKRGRKAS